MFIIILFIFLVGIVDAQTTEHKIDFILQERGKLVFEETDIFTAKLMMDLANVGKKDIVFDLGSGRGVIIIEAAKRGASSIGIEIDSKYVDISRKLIVDNNVEHLAKIYQEDLFASNISKATVIALYMPQRWMLYIKSKLLKELKSGTRIVANGGDFGDWKPAKVVQGTRSKVSLWVR